MIFNINAYWLYGWPAYDIGKHIYNDETKQTKFIWKDKEYDSTWHACSELRSCLYKIKSKVFAGTIGGESMVGIKMEIEVGAINLMPNELKLSEIKRDILESLKLVGFVDLPEPKLYTIVDINDD